MTRSQGMKMALTFSITNTMTIEFIQLTEPTEINLQASAEGDLLVFRNAILVRQEVNANDDEVPEIELTNLANTIGGRAVDVEHDLARNCGAFTAGRVVTDDIGPALSVDGFIWRDRYPVEAEGVMSGTHRLSVEASAERATCSVCGLVFTSTDNYCQHLMSRKRFKATRRVEGLKARGGAVTKRPAGRNTTFDRQQLFLVASHADPIQEETMTVNCPHCHSDVEASDMCSKCTKAISPALLAQQLRDLETQLTTATGEKATLTAEISTLNASLVTAKEAETAAVEAKTAAETAKADAEAKAVKAVEGQRQVQLAMSNEDWETKKAAIMSMTEDAFSLFASVSVKPAGNRLVAGLTLPDKPNTNGAKEPIGL